MGVAANKFAFGMVNPKMFFITDINQAIIAAPFVRMNNRISGYFAANNGLKRFCGNIGNNFGINFAIAFKQAKYNCFTGCAPATFTGSTTAEVAFINFDLAT